MVYDQKTSKTRFWCLTAGCGFWPWSGVKNFSGIFTAGTDRLVQSVSCWFCLQRSPSPRLMWAPKRVMWFWSRLGFPRAGVFWQVTSVEMLPLGHVKETLGAFGVRLHDGDSREALPQILKERDGGRLRLQGVVLLQANSGNVDPCAWKTRCYNGIIRYKSTT